MRAVLYMDFILGFKAVSAKQAIKYYVLEEDKFYGLIKKLQNYLVEKWQSQGNN